MDMLAVSGLVNYFGRQAEVDNIRVSPVLLRKGTTRLALFGLGNVRDERLHRTFARKHLTMCQPAEDTAEWFNLLVLHQNRVAHGPKNHIPEHFLSGFLDLVVWGHEHQCQVDPEYNHQKSFYITQPGSSVATSLSSGEAVPKHVAVLHINKRNFKVDKARLKNVRPFIIEDVVLAAVPSLSPQSSEDEIVEFLRRRVEAMIIRAQQQYIEQLENGFSDIEPALGLQPKPLIRVRVEYSGGFESFHPQRFGLLFADRVANPRDIVYFYRKARASSSSQNRTAASQSTTAGATQDSHAGSSVPAPVDAVHVESLIGEFLDDTSMQMLVDLELAEAIRLFVQKGDADAISQSLKSTINETQKRIMAETANTVVSEAALDAHIAQAREVRRQKAADSGHGMVHSSRDDAMVAVTLTGGKRSAINVADRKAIREFERIAAATAAAKKGRIGGDVQGEPPSGFSDDESNGDSDKGDSSEDDEFRNAGGELNPTKGRRQPIRKPPLPPSASILAPVPASAASKRGRATKTNAKAKYLSDEDVTDESEEEQGTNENTDDIANVNFSIRQPPAMVSRPSRNARTTLASSRSNSSAVATQQSNDTREIEESDNDDADSGGENVTDHNDDDDDSDTIEASNDVGTNKRQRVVPATPSANSHAAIAATRGRGRGRGRGWGSSVVTGATKRGSQKPNTTQRSNSSQIPVVNLDDDDDDDDAFDKTPASARNTAGGGFGRFSLRKKT
ncbi:meiotic recombination [Kickxella alabastrina]|uniref:Meiotic recombination n=1 Tax=Kickxella alabastrina TaxID=61397 RepID=A0ACC1I533_9FUNG|nr:meiotic recombination [Kickxella alabastrina]